MDAERKPMNTPSVEGETKERAGEEEVRGNEGEARKRADQTRENVDLVEMLRRHPLLLQVRLQQETKNPYSVRRISERKRYIGRYP